MSHEESVGIVLLWYTKGVLIVWRLSGDWAILLQFWENALIELVATRHAFPPNSNEQMYMAKERRDLMHTRTVLDLRNRDYDQRWVPTSTPP